MDTRHTLVNMLRQLLKEMEIVSSQGAGYYTCAPFAKRYNKLLGQARTLFPEGDGIIGTFEAQDENDPKDPSVKSKYLMGLRVEISQLISLLESTRGDAVS
ncbi:MAG TPA: hypothetical protein PKI11_17165 [Candidatus Hydrogenedentes bacterium]|nr:hypothetical protein [Candidatus Hydrogenedentota bacterium]HNT87567.1 hypothetical protein [Candidatus Hydrogenedentota bacterium]